MTDSVTTVAPAGATERVVVERLWQLYRHDLSEFRDSWPGPDGRYPTHDLDRYLRGDPDRVAFLIHSGEKLAGFALVRGLLDDHAMIAAFFILRRARQHGIGEQAAQILLGMHAGPWDIAFQEHNPAAARFWRRIGLAADGYRAHEERRPVPEKPWIPPDTWLLLTPGRPPATGRVTETVTGSRPTSPRR